MLHREDWSTLAAVVPLAGAIWLFGVIFGALARPVFGVGVTLASSAMVFSGAVQLTVVGLALGGASPLALVAAAALLNSRNLALGAMLRPHLSVGPLRRAALGWFLIDEVVGLALADRQRAPRTLLTAGTCCYVTWLVGTAVGVVGGGVVPGLAALAAAVFPVLFVALSALSATSRSLVMRAVAAAAITLLLATVWPGGRALAPVVAAVIVALPGGSRSTGGCDRAADAPEAVGCRASSSDGRER